MLGAVEGEYVPCAPGLTAVLPFAPEYLGKSYLPLSSEKCRCPCPCFAALPTWFGASLKFVSLTLAVTVELTVAPFFGAVKLTVAPGAPTVCCSPVLEPLESLPQPAAPTSAAIPMRTALAALRPISVRTVPLSLPARVATTLPLAGGGVPV